MNEAKGVVSVRTARQRSHGPSSGRHADARIAAEALRRLKDSPYFTLRSITIGFHEGVLVLRGQVACYYHKQLAQEMVRHVDGVEIVVNAVDVVDSPEASGPRTGNC